MHSPNGAVIQASCRAKSIRSNFEVTIVSSTSRFPKQRPRTSADTHRSAQSACSIAYEHCDKRVTAYAVKNSPRIQARRSAIRRCSLIHVHKNFLVNFFFCHHPIPSSTLNSEPCSTSAILGFTYSPLSVPICKLVLRNISSIRLFSTR